MWVKPIWCGWDCSGETQEEGKYKHTVDLPKTTFGMRANALVREPEIQKLWDDHQVFKRVSDKNDGVGFCRYYNYDFVLCLWTLLVADL